MIKNNAIIVILITLFVALAVFGTGSALRYMENPSLCSKCHAMGPYYESFTNSKDYPLIQTHKNEGFTCIDCHSPSGQKNRDHVRITIMNKIFSYFGSGNATVDVSLLKIDCVKCHDMTIASNNTEVNPHTGIQNCEVSCHIAHEDFKLEDIDEMDCASCHVEPDISGKHATLDCIGCHPTHGRVPSCTGCHSTHEDSNEKVENSECLECHGSGAHSVIIGSYNKLSNISMLTCRACHEEQYIKIDFSTHGNMGTCVGCHPTHGNVQECMSCHSKKTIYLYPTLKHPHQYHKSVMESGNCDSCHYSRGLRTEVGGCINCHIQDPHTI